MKENWSYEFGFYYIDGDAKDFDDAVYCTKEKDYYKLYVAIADVSFYVDEDSYVDKIALANSFSIYLDKSIPMLPNELSDDLCSLKPNVNRMALVCEIVINQNGIVKSYKFYESIIKSKKRFTYDEVNRIIKIILNQKPILNFYWKHYMNYHWNLILNE